MEIKELNKTQLILLTLLITFVVSIATGIVTVSLMQQAPKSVPQTVNNVIQRTIEKVTTVQVPAPASEKNNTKNKTPNDNSFIALGGDVLVPIYKDVVNDNNQNDTTNQSDTASTNNDTQPTDTIDNSNTVEPAELGKGIIISDVGLILTETSILGNQDKFKVILNDNEFKAIILKKFNNGFTVLRIITNQELEDMNKTDNQTIDNSSQNDNTANVDNQ